VAITLKHVHYLRITHLLVLSFALYLITADYFSQGIALAMISTLFNSIYPPDYGGSTWLSGKPVYPIFLQNSSHFVESFCEIIGIIVMVAALSFLL